MKQIYNFEQHDPPALNENMLRAELERRALRRQTTLTALAGLLSQITMLVLGILALPFMPTVSVFCFCYVTVAMTGSAVLAVICTRKGGNDLWLLLQ